MICIFNGQWHESMAPKPRHGSGCRLAYAVDDAVYLDEDSFAAAQPKVAYVKTIQVGPCGCAPLTQTLHAATWCRKQLFIITSECAPAAYGIFA